MRGILCSNCNGGLGRFRDSIDALPAAAAHLDARDPMNAELRELALKRADGLRRASV